MPDNQDTPDFETRLSAMEVQSTKQQATIDAQAKTIAQQAKTIDGLTKQSNSAPAADPNTEKRIAAMEQKTTAQQATIDQQSKTIKALGDQLKAATEPEETKEKEIPKIPDSTFSVDDQDYKFVVAEFRHKGETMTAIDALNDKDVLAELVKRGSGVIKAVH